MSEHDELESSVAAWVLGAVEPGAAEDVRVHIAGCPECQETVARLRPAVEALTLDVDEVEPPAGLRDRILLAARLPASEPDPKTARVIPLRRRRARAIARAWRIPLSGVAVIVAVALAAGLVVGDQLGRGSAPTPPAQVTHFTLAGHGTMQGSTATVTDLRQDGIALVSFSGLPAAPEGKVYELWLITAGNHADPAGIFLPDANGQRLLVVERPLAGYKVMAVTVEAGPSGVASPTQAPELYGTVA